MSWVGAIPTLLLLGTWTVLLVLAVGALVVIEHLQRLRAWLRER